MINNKKDVTAIILSAGKSSRMGFPKAFLKFEKKITFIEQIINVYNKWNCEKIIVILNIVDYEQFKTLNVANNVIPVINNHLEYSRFYSLKLGIDIVKNNFCFFQNIDNPFIKPNVLDILWEKKDDDSFCVPTYEGKGGHPVLLGNKIIKEIQSLNDVDFVIKDFLHTFKKNTISINDKTVITNINTYDEYLKFFK